MAEVSGKPDYLHGKITVRIRDIEITFQRIGGKLKPGSRSNSSGGRSTHLTDAEYREAIRLAGAVLSGHQKAA